MKARRQYRNFVFTHNNYTEEDEAHYKSLLGGKATYIIYGKEIAPTTGTPHLQGYVELDKRISTNPLSKLIPGAHFEPRHGTQKQAIEYCKKDCQVTEVGSLKKQGQRNDIHDIRELLEEGSNMRDVTANCTSYQSCRFAEIWLKYNEEPRPDNYKEIYWFYGVSGAGKSHTARQMANALSDKFNDRLYIHAHEKWFDNYDANKVVLLDECRPHELSLAVLLAILDKYSTRVPHKGGYREFKADYVFITTILSPEDFLIQYNLSYEDTDQLVRRITDRRHFTTKYVNSS